MPWQEVTTMSQRNQFIARAKEDGANIAAACREFGISRKTGYKWLQRFESGGIEALADRSRRPKCSPKKTPQLSEQAVLDLREAHPAWGGRKLHARLRTKGVVEVPAPSTITAILRRHHKLDPAESIKHTAFKRFERSSPNELWQMDFKGHFAAGNGRCHPLTLLDDHSRFALCLDAYDNERGETVQSALTRLFQCYGLPERILCDNGSPWGDNAESRHTWLTVWLLRVGVKVSHGRPYHPQTQGKEERFHRTLESEVVSRHSFDDLAQCQAHFDRWRRIYNHERPHEAIGLKTPAERYHPSARPFPERLQPVEYAEGELVRKVNDDGRINFFGRRIRIGKAFKGFPVALRPSDHDSQYDVYFTDARIRVVDLNSKANE